MVEINFSLLIPYISVVKLIKKHWRIVCFFEMQENRHENAAIVINIYNNSNYLVKKNIMPNQRFFVYFDFLSAKNMYSRQQLIDQIRQKKSFLCIGLDTDPEKIPDCLKGLKNPVLEFNRQIIDATHDLCIAYKPNTAFYECYGAKGWQNLIDTCNYIPADIFKIADAKRGDLGNTGQMYAKAFFDREISGMGFDAVTVAPYMGSDSVMPFLAYQNKWAILLALTSNESHADFQLSGGNQHKLFEQVLQKSQRWGTNEQLMYVIGATRGEAFSAVRKLVPDHFLLVPGVGTQGGSLADVCKYGMNTDCGLIVNSSRAIIYASTEKDFAEAARAEALKVQQEMERELFKSGFLK